MKYETFVKRLEKGKSNHYIYKKNGLEGLISVWKYNSLYILTWEECKEGEQFDEAGYTKDERYEFKSLDEITTFLNRAHISVEEFTP